ncbi:MAG: RNA polymerase sigma factor [Saprospiraceae bacterium]|nr:RNA polymerase sigma factor [Saprospiraceae bacterium]
MSIADLDELLNACKREERLAQKELYRRFYAYAMSVSLRYADDEDEAIEIANDAFLKVFMNLNRYDNSLPFKPWFRRILINTAINQVKKKRRFKWTQLMDAEFDIPSTEDILARIGFEELMKMVRSLSLAYRTVFNMFVIDGYTHEEIATILGISVGTSKSNLAKARQKLRQLLIEQLQH